MPLASAIWAKADPYVRSLSRMRCLGRWSKGYDFLPRSVHADETADPTIGAHGMPIYQNTAYSFTAYDELVAYRQGKRPHFVYTRDGNPTVRSLEVKLAALEGAEEVVACASGMAGISATLLHLLGGGGQHRREGGDDFASRITRSGDPCCRTPICGMVGTGLPCRPMARAERSLTRGKRVTRPPGHGGSPR
jgi:hypothetical protein